MCQTMSLRLYGLIVVSFVMISLFNEGFGFETHLRGPSFLMEPPARLEFSNSSGGWLDCSASGSPQPQVDWLSVDGAPVGDVSGVRRVLRNGTLVLLPFAAASYRQDVHSTVYRCVASNTVGRVISRDVQVRAVVAQAYKVDAEVLGASRGCTAVLRCVVPSFVKDLVRVVSWLQEPAFYIYPSLQGDGKFHLLPTGELLIHNLEFSDQFPTYRCRTMHRLSRQVVVSSPANVRLNEHRGIVSPSIVEHTSSVQVTQDEGAVLLCVAQGCPTPEYRWYSQTGPEPLLVLAGPRIRLLGPVLAVEAVTPDDAGQYRCTAVNAGGEASAELRLSVTTPLNVEVSPAMLSVHMGGAAEFRCMVTSQGNQIGPQFITWYKDGRQLPGSGHTGQTLLVPSVGREDRGMYQCVVRRQDGDTAQASAELQLGDAPPVLLYSFIEQTLQPGPAVSLKCTATGNPTPQITWALDGFPLPTNGRFVIGQYVTVHGDVISHVNISHVMVEDGGEYSCAAENRAGKTSHAARLNVYGAPYIRLIPKVTAVAGEGMQLKCPVAGYPIEEIHWERSGRELPEDIRQRVQPDGSLVVSPVQKNADSGVYTCWAKNKQGHSARRSGEVTVIVPPRWIVEPADLSVERNRHVSLHCQAQGVPVPTVVWKKAIGGKSGDYEEVRERPYTKLLPNGTLLLQHVKEDREGYYLCQANNGIGTGIGKVIQLKVNSSPYFSAPSRLVTVKKGDRATLFCDVSGDKPINIIWLRGGKQELNPNTNYRVAVKQDATPDGVRAEIMISATEAKDSGAYFCQASNQYGRDQQLVQLLVQEPPKAPEALEAAMVSSRSVNIKWMRRSSGASDASDVAKYIVQYREGDRSWQQIELAGMITPGVPSQFPPTSALIEDLKPATRYSFRVIAEGPAGRSAPSLELSVRTEPQRPAGAPMQLSARPVSSTEVLVTWSPPLPELRHGEIQGYNVGYRSNSAISTHYNFSSVSGDGEDGSGELLLGGLDKFSRYSVVVQAFNQIGPGPLSEPATVQTMEDVPSMPPEDVRCAALTSQSLQVSWQPPPPKYCNGLLQGYKLFYEPVVEDHIPGVNDDMETRKTTALTTVLTGLRRYTNYSMQVLAFTRIGDGVLTHTSYCRTEEDVPEAPADIKVVVSSPQSLFVSWLPPIEPNGIITKYILYIRAVEGREELNHNKRNLAASQTTFEAKDLQQHAEYQFWVTASTRVGEGKSSRVVSQISSNRVPARITSFGGPVVRPWRGSVTLQCKSVGDPRREWLRGEVPLRAGSQHNAQLLDTGELQLNALQRSDSANYTCQVDNGVGTDRLTYHLIVQIPPGPPVLYVTSATSSSILLHWKSGDTGAAPLSGYTLHYRRAHGSLEEMVMSRHASSHELKGLQCGSTYHLYLTARNKIGSSPASPTLLVRTQGQSPGTPASGALLAPNSTSVVLRLHVWPDNGCPLLYFVLQYRAANDAEWTLVSNALKPQRRFTISGLQPASLYRLRMEAHNIAGQSQADFSFVTLTKDGEPPPPELVKLGGSSASMGYVDFRVIIPTAVSVVAVFLAAAMAFICWRTRQVDRARKESLENQQNAEAQRERYYATIHKVALQAGQDKIPETSDDISPYATFQLSEASTLAAGGQLASVAPGGNTLLHSFMYHERAGTEGCASTPPPQREPRTPSSYGAASPYRKVGKGRRRHARKTDIESDSESDQDQLTSSRTESSNHLDGKHKHGLIYHGTTHSSTSSDLSPMSEQKSLPRRGRTRWVAPGRNAARSLSIAETGFAGPQAALRASMHTPGPEGHQGRGIGDRLELSEAECDMDTMKNLKLGLRSSLWARPNSGTPNSNSGGGGGLSGGGHPSDYSIAV